MRSWGVVLLIVLTVTAGCLDAPGPLEPTDTQKVEAAAPVWNTEGPYSRVLENGTLDVLPVERLDLPGFDGTNIAAAVWRPDVPPGTKVPVILHAGPYFGDTGLTEEDPWTREFWLPNFVQHGFAFVKVATRGTSHSGGCIEWWGPNEAKDMDATVTHFGTMEWSNGNVGMVGLSYAGGMAWVAASFGNPHLKTIVPAGATTDVGLLHYLNGTIAETNSPTEHVRGYWLGNAQGGRSEPSPRWAEAACEEVTEGAAANLVASATGDISASSPFAKYWAERDYRERVVENYRGSVFSVHGFHDYNNDGHQIYPMVNELEEQGVKVHHMLGQWGHTRPDVAADDERRWDWAQKLLEWFDAELRDGPPVEYAAVDVQDNLKQWRTEETWPPRDVNWTTFSLGDGTITLEPSPEGSSVAFDPAGMAADARRLACCIGDELTRWTFTTGPLEEELRFAGAPQIHLTVTPLTDVGGEVYVDLWERSDERSYFLTRAIMDLRYHAGGKAPGEVAAGEPVRAHLQAEPMDAVIPPGSQLIVRILPAMHQSVGGLEPESRNAAPIELSWGGDASILRLPLIERDVGDGRYPGQPDAQ